MCYLTDALFGLLVAVQVVYSLIIIGIIYFWNRENDSASSTFFPNVSVVIAARNEAENLPILLTSLINQNYPNEKLEILIADDQSTDATFSLAETFSKQHKEVSIKVFQPKNTIGKKACIRYLIEKASGEIILCTDADCSMQKGWVRSMVKPFSNEQIMMSLGMVNLVGNDSFFTEIQRMEFAGLIAVAISSTKAGFPLLSNGANLAYRKNAFVQSGGFENDGFASGDDVFLLYKFKKLYPKGIAAVPLTEAIVNTKACSTFSSFWEQRKRWVAKNRFLPDLQTIFVGGFTYASATSLPIFALFAFMCGNNLFEFFLVLLFKFMIDAALIISLHATFHFRKILPTIFVAFVANLGYVCLVLPLASVGSRNFSWKERLISR